MKKYIFSLVLFVLTLAACNLQSENLGAPVIDAWQQPISIQGAHHVAPGETLYSIAWRYGRDYREIARINHIPPPYDIHIGQAIYLVSPTEKKTTIKPVLKQQIVSASEISKSNAIKPKAVPQKVKSYYRGKVRWQWPSKGVVIAYFHSGNLAHLNQGIDIAGNEGTPIKAAASGQVVYAGNGLPGYGNLIIIKHNGRYLSAYAHNKKMQVKNKTFVKAGQVIATMGRSGNTNRVKLHFEIRRAGKPVDPLLYLPK